MTKSTDYLNSLSLQYKKPPITEEKYKDLIESDNFYNYKEGCNPEYSILIVAYNEDALIFKLFEKIYSSSSNNYELLVIDNGLTNETRDKLKTFSLRHIVLNENVGCSAGRNIGALFCCSDVIFFVDADGILENIDIVAEKVAYLKNSQDLVAIRGKVVEHKKRTFLPGPKNYDLGNEKLVSFLDAECITLIKKEDFVRVGGFEDGMAGHEGIVLSYRMVEYYGYDPSSIIYDPDLVLYHNYTQGIVHPLEKKLRYMLLWEKVKLAYPLLLHYSSDTLKLRKVSVKNNVIQKTLNRLINFYTNKKFRKAIVEELENHKILTPSDKTNFSVVITCFNMGKLIKRAIDSILDQTLNGIQLIVVDDCSNDPETIALLKDLSPDIELIKLEENSGVSAARNRGIKESKASYICCLDGDDYLSPTYLEKAKKIFDNYPETGIVSAYQKAFGGNNWTFKPDQNINIVDALVDNPIPSASCFRKSASVEVNMYDENLRSHEDWDHWIKILGNNWKVKVIPEYCINYYVRKNSKFLNNVDKAEYFSSIIVDNNKDLYQKNIAEIFSKKHARHTKRREDYRKIKYSFIVRCAEYILDNLVPGFMKPYR